MVVGSDLRVCVERVMLCFHPFSTTSCVPTKNTTLSKCNISGSISLISRSSPERDE